MSTTCQGPMFHGNYCIYKLYSMGHLQHIHSCGNFYFFLAFDFCRSYFSSPPQRPMTSDFEGCSTPDCIHYIFYPIFILEKEPVFPFLMLSAKQGNYGYHFYNAFGMTRSLTFALKASTITLANGGGG